MAFNSKLENVILFSHSFYRQIHPSFQIQLVSWLEFQLDTPSRKKLDRLTECVIRRQFRDMPYPISHISCQKGTSSKGSMRRGTAGDPEVFPFNASVKQFEEAPSDVPL